MTDVAAGDPTPTAPAPGIVVTGGLAPTGGPVIALANHERRPNDASRRESLRSGITQAGPVAIAGLVTNGASALVVVAVARIVDARSYGAIAQLLGLFFILSMPGSAVLIGVVRRVAVWRQAGHSDRVHLWVRRVHRMLLAAIGVEAVGVIALQGWIARELSLPNDQGVVLILVAAGIWILLSVDRGLLQAHRDYRALAGNLVVEGAIRTVCVVGFVASGMGVAGYALGIFTSELTAMAHARWLVSRAWPTVDAGEPSEVSADSPGSRWSLGTDSAPGTDLVRRHLVADVSAAFVGLALLGLLQNVDVILLGRLNHAQAGSYAAISVASKALVFGALALGSYLLPEATIRWTDGGHAIRQLAVTMLFLAVPAVALLGIALVVPRWFLTLVFSARLASAAPAFAALVAAMIFLCVSVLLTNYLFGAGRRWIVLLLLGGSGLAVILVSLAHGHAVATARADLVVQAALAVAMSVAFVVVHHNEHGDRWREQIRRAGGIRSVRALRRS